jgi:hypothetical protein
MNKGAIIDIIGYLILLAMCVVMGIGTNNLALRAEEINLEYKNLDAELSNSDCYNLLSEDTKERIMILKDSVKFSYYATDKLSDMSSLFSALAMVIVTILIVRAFLRRSGIRNVPS